MSIQTTNGMTILDDLDSQPNGPGIIQQLGNQVDLFYGRNLPNAGSLPTVGDFPGQRVWLTDDKSWATWNGTAWISGPVVPAKTYNVATSTVNCNSGTPTQTIPGLSQAVQITATTDVLYVRLELDFSNGGNTIWSTRPIVDSTPQKDLTLNMVGGRHSVVKTWRVTGLSVGSHTITADATFAAGTAFDIVGGSTGFTSMIIER